MAEHGLYETKMNASTATEAVVNLNTVLLLDVPAGVQFGLDCQCFIVGERFKGVKMIPPGVHFISVCQSTASAPVSFFAFFNRSEILIRRWDAETEQLEEIKDSDQLERLSHGVRRFDFDRGLAPYDAAHGPQWRKLSSWIRPTLVERLMNGHPFISIAEEARGVEGLSKNIPSEAALIEQLKPLQESTSDQQPQRLSYTLFPAHIQKSGCSAAELSAMNMDKTQRLMEMLEQHYSGRWESLLGEIQFAFVVFLFGQSLSALEQWKRILHFLLGCFDGASTLGELFKEFLKLLRHQLQFLVQRNEGIEDVTELLSTSFLKQDLLDFGQVLMEEMALPESVKKECNKLLSFVQDKLHWELPEDDEYAPVVVT